MTHPLYFLTNSLELVNQVCDIRRKQSGGNGQQDDAEEFTDEVNTSLTQQVFYLAGHLQDNVHPYHIQNQG